MDNNIEYFRMNGLEGLYEEIKKKNKEILDEVKCKCDEHSHGGEGGDTPSPSDIQSVSNDEIDALFND